MRVIELKIQNFRGIKDLHLMFNSEHNVVVLVGINGIGKSSVLNCINLLVKYYDLVLRGKTHRRMSGSPILQTFIQESDIRIGSSNSINQSKTSINADRGKCGQEKYPYLVLDKRVI